MNLKFCSNCKNSKTLDSFGKDISTKSGLTFYCLECRRKHRKASYEKNKEKVNM